MPDNRIGVATGFPDVDEDIRKGNMRSEGENTMFISILTNECSRRPPVPDGFDAAAETTEPDFLRRKKRDAA